MRSAVPSLAVFCSFLTCVTLADLNIDTEPSEDIFSNDVPASEPDNPLLAFSMTDQVNHDGIVDDPNLEQTLSSGTVDEQNPEIPVNVVDNCPPDSIRPTKQRKARRGNGYCVPSTREREAPVNSGETQNGDQGQTEPDAPEYKAPVQKRPLTAKKNLKICPRGIFFDSNIAVCHNGVRVQRFDDANWVHLIGGYLLLEISKLCHGDQVIWCCEDASLLEVGPEPLKHDLAQGWPVQKAIVCYKQSDIPYIPGNYWRPDVEK